MILSDFDYSLPKELIAQSPAEPRSSSRLMVLNGEKIEHRRFYEIVKYLRKGDVLVINDSKVVPARLFGRKKSGGKIEVLLVNKVHNEEWECLIRGKNVRAGTEIMFKDNVLSGVVIDKREGKFEIEFNPSGNFDDILERLGHVPVPPYIKTNVKKDRYQTVYAKNPGSIAAPTAGLHFTGELLKDIKDRGVKIASVTLHVGLGTFSPVRVKDIAKHPMQAEYLEIDEKNARIINQGIENGRVIAVGTTTIKALESACNEKGNIQPTASWSDLFIYPGYRFKTSVDGLITNFHLPKSTLLMLVCAFAGRDRIFNAYSIAIQEGYRFYSLGDAMFIIGAMRRCLK